MTDNSTKVVWVDEFDHLASDARAPVDIQDITTRQYDAAMIRMLDSMKISRVNGVTIKEKLCLDESRKAYKQIKDLWWVESETIAIEASPDFRTVWIWTILTKRECANDKDVLVYGPKDKVLDYLHRCIYPAYEAPGL